MYLLGKINTMSKKARSFAPSPTGPLTFIVGVRTALFNYLFAKKKQRRFHIENWDTDFKNRYVQGGRTIIIDALNCVNIPFDEVLEKRLDLVHYARSEEKIYIKI